jgi:hypothetical protein
MYVYIYTYICPRPHPPPQEPGFFQHFLPWLPGFAGPGGASESLNVVHIYRVIIINVEEGEGGAGLQTQFTGFTCTKA